MKENERKSKKLLLTPQLLKPKFPILAQPDARLCENKCIVMLREPILSIDIFPSEKGKTERGVLAFIIYFQLVI